MGRGQLGCTGACGDTVVIPSVCTQGLVKNPAATSRQHHRHCHHRHRHHHRHCRHPHRHHHHKVLCHSTSYLPISMCSRWPIAGGATPNSTVRLRCAQVLCLNTCQLQGTTIPEREFTVSHSFARGYTRLCRLHEGFELRCALRAVASAPHTLQSLDSAAALVVVVVR